MKLPASLRKYIPWLPYLVATWLTMSFIGYGLALRNHSAVKKTGNDSIGERRGRLTWVNVHFPRSGGVSFKMENDSMTYRIPAEYVESDAHWKDIDELYKPGLSVWFKWTIRSREVVELAANPNTPFQKMLVTWNFTANHRALKPQQISAEGSGYLWTGFAILPLTIAGLFVSRRVRRRRAAQS